MGTLLVFLAIQAGSSFLALDVQADGEFAIADGAPLTGTNDSPTGRNPRLLWTNSFQATWNRWETEYQANTTSPATVGGKLTKQLKVQADDTSNNPNTYILGQQAAARYQQTGNSFYVTQALNQLHSWADLLPPRNGNWNDPFGWDANYVRVWMGRLTVAGERLWPGMTQAQRDFWFGFILDNIEHHILVYAGAEDGWTNGDSDQLLGPWMCLAMLQALFPGTAASGNARIQSLWGLSKTGGLTATAENRTTTARNAIKLYFNTMAAGGEFIETGEYNIDTLKFTLEGYLGLRTFYGTDYFPEITAYLPYFAKSLITQLTPGLANNHKYEDEENPDGLFYHEWGGILPQVAACLEYESAGSGGELNQLFQDMGTLYGYGASPGIGPSIGIMHHFYGYDETATATDYKTSANKYFFSSGYGLQRLRNGYATSNSAWGVHSSVRIDDTAFGSWWVDHLGRGLNKVWLWKGGERAVRPIFTYAGAGNHGEGSWSPLMLGLGDCMEYKKTVAHNEDTTHAYYATVTGGSILPKNYTQPPVVVHEWTRSTLCICGATDVCIMYDRSNVDDIASGDQPLYPGYNSGAGGGEGDFWFRRRARKQFIAHPHVNPTVVSSDNITWTTDGGQKMRYTVLAPTGLTTATFDELNDLRGGVDAGWPHGTVRYGWANSNVLQAEPRWQYQHYSNSKWTAFASVVLVHGSNTPPAPTIHSVTGSDLIHVTRSGESDIVAIFNSTQSSDLNTTAYHASHAAALQAAHFRPAGTYAHSWTASNGTSEIYIMDLNPSLSWTKNVDGGGATSITPDSGGFYRTTVSGTGAHTITVVGS